MEDVLIYGLLRGGIFAAAAFGFSLVLGVIGIVNFAHGVLVVFGGLCTQWLATRFGLPYLVALPGAIAATGLVAVLMQRLFISRTFRLEPMMVLVQTFGIAAVVTELTALAWGTQERLLRVAMPLPAGFFLGETFVPSFDLLVFAVSLLSAGALFVLLAHTEFGRAIRAASDNPESAQLHGVDLARTYEKTMLVAGLWSGLAGGLFVTLSPLAPYMHFNWTVDSFLVIIIGGLGSMVGALLGGLLFGVLSFGASFYVPTIAPAVTFGVLLLFLVFRPEGLLGATKAKRK